MVVGLIYPRKVIHKMFLQLIERKMGKGRNGNGLREGGGEGILQPRFSATTMGEQNMLKN